MGLVVVVVGMAGFVGVFVGCFGSVFDSRARAVTNPV